MTYNDVIKRLESIGVEINYESIEVSDLNAECENISEFEESIKLKQNK